MSVVHLTQDNFKQEVYNTTDTVLIDFWATWCNPCRMLGPVIEQIANEAPAGVKICKCDVDANPALAMEFQVMSIPMLVVIKDGKQVASSVGVIPKQAILDLIARA